MAEHGTYARYQQHKKEKTIPCIPCVTAVRDYQYRWRQARGQWSGRGCAPGLGWPLGHSYPSRTNRRTP